LQRRPDIEEAMRAHLRSQARAVDVAEAQRRPDLVSEANRTYLASLQAAGLTPKLDLGPGDPFDRLLAELGGSASGGFDTAQP
jgi:hypothetical protein